MKNFFSAIFLFFIAFFSFSSFVFGQLREAQEFSSDLLYKNNLIFSATQIPGLDCGIAGATDGSNKCCNNPDVNEQKKNPHQGIDIPFIEGILNLIDEALSKAPFFGGIYSLIKEYPKTAMERLNYLYELQKKYGNIQCIYGEAKNESGKCICRSEAEKETNLNQAVARLCYNYLVKEKGNELKNCLSCAAKNSVYTGIGCIPLNMQKFVSEFLLSIGIGLGGIVALLCIIYSSVMIQTSAGNPEKLKKAQENLTSCILGLIIIIFSVFIIRLIGVDILRIPFL